MFIGLSHGGTTIYSSPSRPDEVWVGTKEGIVVIERAAGAGWTIGRRLLEDKHISAILTEPESGSDVRRSFSWLCSGHRRWRQNLGDEK